MIYLIANFYVRTLARMMARMARMSAFLAREWHALARIGGVPQDYHIVPLGITKVLLACMACIYSRLVRIRAYSQSTEALLYRQSYIKHACHACQAGKITYRNE